MDIYASRYNDLEHLVKLAELKDIQFHELSARLFEHQPDAVDESAEAQVDLVFQTRVGEDDFGVRVSVTATTDAGEAKTTVAADYAVDQQHHPDEELLELFATEVAMMAIFPYVREGIQSATTRVFGTPLTLPILQRGEVRTDRKGQS